MSAGGFVATLIAAPGKSLTQRYVETAFDGEAERIVLIDKGRAADIFTPDRPVISSNADCDVLIQPAATRRKKLLIADMESTIIEQEMLDELAAEIGVGEKVAEITRRAMNNELDFVAALNERVALLKGHPASLLDKVASRMTLMPGAQQLVAAMKKSGARCWLVSGGFTFFVRIIAERLGFDAFHANDLIVEKGTITGEVRQPVLGKDAKKTLLDQACATYGCTLAETIAVGDGANDIPMLLHCGQGGGLGVAYHAKPKVRELIHSQINRCDLSALIYAQGLVPEGI